MSQKLFCVSKHVSIALGSHAEIETCVEIAVRLKYLSRVQAQRLDRLLSRAGQLLNGLRARCATV
jgi:four helix bundle protein